MPNHYVGDLLPTIGISGLFRVRTELLHLAVIAALAPHPVQMHCESPGHSYLGDLPSAPPFWLVCASKSLLGPGSRHCYGIIALKLPRPTPFPTSFP